MAPKSVRGQRFNSPQVFADAQLHDYWFTFVNGVAITFGLVDEKDAQAILDKLVGKMAEVGYQDFRFGLPGNLVPVRRGDYLLDETPPEVFGVPRREDGSTRASW